MRRVRDSGFTLVEATITIAIIAMVAGVTVMEVGARTRADLRAASSKLAAAVRTTYDNASLTGQTHRLVFEIDSATIRSEATSQAVTLGEGRSAPRADETEGEGAGEDLASFLGIEKPPPEEEKEEDAGHSAGSAELSGVVAAFLGGGSRSAPLRGGPASFTPGPSLTLDGDVKVLDVWVEGMSEPSKEGAVYLYFFPAGFTQDAVVNLQDEDGNVYHARVQALTGKTLIEAGYLEPPK